jgi:hypothetical protein
MTEALKDAHTPGPLVAIDCGNNAEWDVVKLDTTCLDGCWYVATCHDGADSGSAEGNARLFAAAPDLLAACQHYMSVIDTPFATSDDDMRKAYDMMRLAIAKVEGDAK